MHYILALFLLYVIARGTFAAYVNLAAPGFFPKSWHPVEGMVDYTQ